MPFAPGGPTHLTGEVLRSMTRSHIVHVPFKGNAQALTELMSGIIKAPDMQERFVAQGVDLVSRIPEQFAALIKTEAPRWRKIVQESGAKVD